MRQTHMTAVTMNLNFGAVDEVEETD